MVFNVKCQSLIKEYYVSNHENSFSNDFCDTGVCIKDSERILNWLDPKVNYCNDFYDFTCGSFDKYVSFQPTAKETINIVFFIKTSLDERYDSQGISRLVESSNSKIFEDYLSQPVQQEENPAIKLAKYVFHKCVDRSRYQK